MAQRTDRGAGIDIRPQPGPQEAFLAARHVDIAFYGGGKGGGKTWSLVTEALRHAHVPGYTAVIFRRTMPQIRQEGGLWDTSQTLYPHLSGVDREQTCDWRFGGGGQVKFAHLQYDHTVRDWDGAQICYLAFDELQHFSEYQFWYMRGMNRSVCGVRPYMRATCMPDASSWIREFIDWWVGADGTVPDDRSGVVRHFVRHEDEVIWEPAPFIGPDGQHSVSFTFIRALLDDNPALLAQNPDYRATLSTLDDVDRRRYLLGDWNARPLLRGRIYREFSPERHILASSYAHLLDVEQIRRSHFDFREGWDFGTGATAATAVIWAWYDASADRLYLWDWHAAYERDATWWADVATERRQGRTPRAVGDPAGRQRDAAQKHWFRRLEEAGLGTLHSGVNRPNETIATMRWAFKHSKIRLHPRCSEKRPIGPRSGGKRLRKSLVDALLEYQWDVPQDYDAAGKELPGATRPLKDWASHPVDALGYIVRDLWGYVAPGVTGL